LRQNGGIPVNPDLAIDEATDAGIIIVPELWLAPTDNLHDWYPEVKD